MTRLLQGKQVVLFADISNLQNLEKLCAIKFTDIRIKIKSHDLVIDRKLEPLLKGIRVTMQHSGISHYAHEGKVYQIANDEGLALGYKFGESDRTVSLAKIKAGDPMLSPYTHWAIQFDLGSLDLYGTIDKWFFSKTPKIELQLEGSAQYIWSK
jgi:hypothetical protein